MKEKKIGFFGTGLMGYPMAERLFRLGYNIEVYNRTYEKTGGLQKLGIKAHSNPAELISEAEIIISMLADFNAIRQTLLNENAKLFNGKTLLQMSTVGVKENIEIEKTVRENGGRFLEAPVLGSIPQVKEGTLIIMTGGEKELHEELKPLLDDLGEKVVYAGGTGKAAAMKLSLNQLIASLTAAFSTSLGLVREHGVDVDLFMDILRNSALYAPTFDKKLNRMLERNFENPNFPLKHLLKDVNLILNETGQAGIKSEVVQSVKEIVQRGLAMGLDEEDYSSLYNAVHIPKKI